MPTRLNELICRPTQIVTALAATDRWQAIDELVGVLAQDAGFDADRAAGIAGAVRAREQTMSTGIGHGVGIPHAETELVDRVTGVLGIARHDVDFSALDNAPVRIVLLFVVPKAQIRGHLDTLSSIARVLSDDQTRTRIRMATEPEEVLAILAATGGG
jgi:mannitol/fructose-specific phosphotransferase system IIA component (Ntr-type)